MSELSVNRRNTTAFIAARPVEIALIPVATTQTASGGRLKGDLPARPAQTFRLLDQSTNTGNNPGRLSTDGGHQFRATYQLLGEWDAVLAVGDHWTDDAGAGWKVQELLPYNGYETRARVVEYGGQ